MKQFNEFIFKDYQFDHAQKTLVLTYGLDDSITFTETYRFDFDFSPDLDAATLDKACQTLFFMAGVSYYKTYLPPKISVVKGELDEKAAQFFAKTYQRGLGEFYYINQLDPSMEITFPHNASAPSVVEAKNNQGLLVGIGGGKDSLVSVELLRNQPKVATWSLGHRAQLEPLIARIGLPHFWVEREWDRSLIEHNEQGAYNGHIPFSAILACVGTVVGVLTGYQDVVVSNEASANEPMLTHEAVPINHQYSKSIEFEKDFQTHLQRNYGECSRYYSLLRPFSELRVSELFAKLAFQKYRDVFNSCNRAYTHYSDHAFWCGACPKCAFVFLMLAPFVDQAELLALFDGRNLLLEPTLETTYRELLGISGNRPLDCVGEIKETRYAMRLLQQRYPELSKYRFDVPADYDYKALQPHSMPEEIFSLVRQRTR